MRSNLSQIEFTTLSLFPSQCCCWLNREITLINFIARLGLKLRRLRMKWKLKRCWRLWELSNFTKFFRDFRFDDDIRCSWKDFRIFVVPKESCEFVKQATVLASSKSHRPWFICISIGFRPTKRNLKVFNGSWRIVEARHPVVAWLSTKTYLLLTLRHIFYFHSSSC